jgi:DNA-binding transcriptional regulator YiaG
MTDREIIQLVKRLREVTKGTQSEMAAKVGVDLRTWQKWEYGERRPSRATVTLLVRLTEDAGLDLADLSRDPAPTRG